MGYITHVLLLCGLIAVSLCCTCVIPTNIEKFEIAKFGTGCVPMAYHILFVPREHADNLLSKLVWNVTITTALENIDPPSVDNSTYGYTLNTIYSDDEEKGCFPLNPTKINTATSSATCGVDWLEGGKNYIISGKLTQAGGKLLIDSCNSLVLELTTRIQKKLWKRLKRSVKAKETICTIKG